MATTTRRDAAFTARLRSSVRAFDAAALAAVPLVLVGVYALPDATRESLVLAYESPTFAAMYGSHFVHKSLPHLLTNLAAYLLVVPPAYGYCALAGRREEFFVTFAVVLGTFPFVLSVMNVALVRPRVGYGFSGLAMAFLGFLPVALAAFAREHLSRSVTLDHAPFLFFASAGIVVVLAAPFSLLGAAAVAAAAMGVGLYGASLWRALGRDGLRRAAGRVGYAEFAVLGVLLGVLFPFVAFPRNIGVSGGLVNVYTHLLGYCLGFLASFATLRVLAEIPD